MSFPRKGAENHKKRPWENRRNFLPIDISYK